MPRWYAENPEMEGDGIELTHTHVHRKEMVVTPTQFVSKVGYIWLIDSTHSTKDVST